MSKQKKKGLVPELRFPEFLDKGEWEAFSLGNFAEFYKGKGLPKSSIREDGKKLCIHYGELFTKYSEVIKEVDCRTNQENSFLSVDNDVLMPTSDVTPNGLAKASCIKLDDVILGGDILVIRTDQTEFSGEFISRYIRHEEQQVLKFVTGITVYHLYPSSISKLYLSKPKIEEQQKITDCLSSLDQLIATHTKKHQALQRHKKGLLQNLFPAEGETVPKLRFPEFRDKGEWESKQLGKLSTILRGGSPRPIDSYLTAEPEGLNWLKIGDVDQEAKYISRTEERVKVTALRKTREVYPSDLIMSNSMSFGRPYIMKIKSCIHDGWIAVTKISDSIHRDYLYYFILSNSAQTYFTNAAAGGGIKNLNVTIIKSLSVVYPKLGTEQQKIANCLSAIDELITAQAQKIEALKAHKKGLMQRLFPSMDEVSS